VRRGGVLGTLVAAGAIVLGSAFPTGAAAASSQSGGAQDEGLALQAELGLGGVYIAGKWAPVTIWSTAHAPMSGELSLRYGLDPTQAMRISAGFAATPGQLAPAQVAAPMPNWLNELEIDAVAIDAAGKRWTGGVTMSSRGGRDLRLPSGLSEQTVLIGVVGASSAVRAVETLTGSPPASAPSDSRSSSAAEAPSVARLSGVVDAQPRLIGELREAAWVRLDAARLPEIALGYDALSLLIIRADAADEMATAQVDAVRQWTRAGGRLLLLASSAGDHWRRWLDGDGALPVSLSGSASVPTPPAIAAIGRAATAEAPASLSARAITLTDAGAASGWRIWWGAGSSGAASDPGATGLLARGPLGLGWVTVVGVEPGGAIGDSGSELVTGMWLEAALDPLEPALVAAMDDSPRQAYSPWGGGELGPEQLALTGVLDAMSFAPPAGVGAFLAIAIAAGLLALLVGPVDYFVLGRLRARGRWWLTSLLWIGAASAIAWSGPLAMLGAEPTSVQRHETIDIRILGDASAEPSWTTGVTALFSAQPGAVTFTGQAPGSWWRGASPLASEYWGEQTPATLATLVRVRGPGPSGPGQGHLDRTPIRMWTLRTFLDHSEGARPFAARLAGDLREVEVAGLGAGERVEEIAMISGERAWSSKLGGGEFQTEASGRTQRVRWQPGEPTRAARTSMIGSVLGQTKADNRPAPFALEGAGRRSDTIDCLLASGRFAAIYIETISDDPAVSVAWEAEYHTRRVYRIVTPIRSEP
jgi:hypothetical protein